MLYKMVILDFSNTEFETPIPEVTRYADKPIYIYRVHHFKL